MINALKTFIECLREPRPEWIVDCRIHAYVHPKYFDLVVDYMNDFFVDGVIVEHISESFSPDFPTLSITFQTEEWAANEVVTTFYIIQDDLESMCNDGFFVVEQVEQRKPSLIDSFKVKWKTFLSRTKKRRYRINKKWSDKLSRKFS